MTDRLDIGVLTVPGGFFVKRSASVEASSFKPSVRSRRKDPQHCYTYRNSGTNIKDRVLELINGAQEKIFIASFRLGDGDLIDALFRAVDRLQGGVYVITCLDERSLSRGADLEDDVEISEKAQQQNFIDLAQRGIYVRGHESCHAKFILADDSRAVVSSANLETRAFEVTGENGVLIRDPGQVAILSKFFARMWFEGCVWELAPRMEGTAVTKRNPAGKTWSFPPVAKRCPWRLVWTHHDEHDLLESMHEMISSAKREILLSTFSLNLMREHPGFLLDPLAELKKRRQGVPIRLLCRARNNKASQRRDAQELLRLGVEIFADGENHAKGIVTDRKRCLLFSANFDAEHGLDSGVEMGVLLEDNSPPCHAALEFFEHTISYAPYEFTSGLSNRELNERLDTRWSSRWPLPEKLIVRATDPDWKAVCSEARQGPVLFAGNGKEKLSLLAGKKEFGLKKLEWGVVALSSVGDTPGSNSTFNQWLTRRSNRDDIKIRGLCPATLQRQG